jgi:hypothetical protein
MADERESVAAAGRELAGVVLDAFTRHRLVGIGESHGLQDHHDALQLLLADPRLPEVADDIVAEFGNARYQDTMDRFIVGQPVADADLRAVWRNTTQSPRQTWDAPVYEQFYRTVRAVNRARPAGRRIRVLLGDPPIDWAAVTDSSGIGAVITPRDAHAASVVEQQVLAKGHRALLCYGAAHLVHPDPSLRMPPSLASIIEQRTGERMYTICDLVPSAADPGGLADQLSRYPRGAVLPAAGTWLGSVDAGLLFHVIAFGPNRAPVNPFRGVPLGSLLDAGLYLGQPADLTASRPNPAIYLDPAYWKELQRRNTLLGGRAVDLDSYRREQPAQYPLPQLPPLLERGTANPARN